MSQSDLLFVYGMLRRKCTSGAHQHLLQDARLLGEALLQAKLFQVTCYPAITLTQENAYVHGEVYALTDVQQLAAIDTYEEYDPSAKMLQEYRRERVTVSMMHAKEFCQAWAYVYQRDTAKLTRITSGDFLKFSATD